MKTVVTDKGTRTNRKFVDVDVCNYLAAEEHGPSGEAMYELKSLQV